MCGGTGLSNDFSRRIQPAPAGFTEPVCVDWLVGVTTLMRKDHRWDEEFESYELRRSLIYVVQLKLQVFSVAINGFKCDNHLCRSSGLTCCHAKPAAIFNILGNFKATNEKLYFPNQQFLSSVIPADDYEREF